jgi:hypothetical protein
VVQVITASRSEWIAPFTGLEPGQFRKLVRVGIPEVARRARLRQKMKGIARVYDHVTPAMRRMILDVLETRWLSSLAVLTLAEQARLVSWFPHVQTTLDDLQSGAVRKLMSAKYPHNH